MINVEKTQETVKSDSDNVIFLSKGQKPVVKKPKKKKVR